MQAMQNQWYEIEWLKWEYEKHRHIDLIRKFDEPLKALENTINEAIKIPSI